MRPEIDDSGRPSRVLIVDNERQNRQVLEAMLSPEGFQLLTANSGEEALAIVAQQAPDLILLDIRMPGMNGYEVTEAIKSNPATKNIPVVMVTALGDHDARMRCLDAGAEDFLAQPVDRAELCARVRNLLRLKAYGDHHDRYSQRLEAEVGSRTADLVESERLYRSTFDSAPIGIVHVGFDGEGLRVNQRLCDLLGYSRDELQSVIVDDLLRSKHMTAEADAFRQMAAGTVDHVAIEEKQYRRRDGSFVWARVNLSVHRAAGGDAPRVIAVVEDITERRALESQIRQASKMDAIGQLASGVAHDFNNLLTVILGFTELVLSDGEVASRHGKDLAEIVKAAHHASGLTRQLLAFSRQQRLQTAPVDLNELIRDMAAMLGRLIGEHIQVAVVLAPDLSLALADRGQMEQVVMNLVVNARDAMPRGGTVTIATTDVELGNASFHEEPVAKGPYVMLAITDTGTGMSNETRRRLFEPFFTTKETGRGTGLGLSTTYGIVKQSKGYIRVDSELDVGTTFRVYLPRAPLEAPHPGVVPVAQAPETLASETVLLVEDEAGVRHLSKRILVSAGYRVLEAANGDDAERSFAHHRGAVDLVIADVIMPGCGGPELMRRLHVQVPALRALYMSGYTEQSVGRRAGLAGGQPFVQKPFTAAEFLKSVRDALGH